jgi:hypothetical protein
MKIGIVGPPGVGKTELAQGMAEHLRSLWHDGVQSEVTIIDDYIEEISTECDLYIDADATYIGNLYTILGRYARERTADPNAHRITCGTFLDSSIYASMQAVGGQDPAKTELLWTRISNFMNVVGTFYQDTYDYDLLFVAKYESPDEAGREAWETMNNAIDMATGSFGVEHVMLTGTKEERLAKAVETIDGFLHDDSDREVESAPQAD